MRNAQNKESGQAIVLIALSMVALIAFAGLAIDGGMVYVDRRHAQNASDAGSLSGGGATALTLENEDINYKNFECPPFNEENGTYDEGQNAFEMAVKDAMDAAEVAAIDQMEENGYTLTDFSVLPFCHESLSNNFNNYIDITTTITKETELTFIRIVYDGPIINRVDATTRVTPEEPWAFGNAIIALNNETDCDNASSGGIKFGGTGQVDIVGGGAFSNGCLVAKGNCNVIMENALGSEDVPIEGIAYHGGNFGQCPVMTPIPVYSDEPLPSESYTIPPPDCTENISKTITLDSIAIHSPAAIVNIPDDYKPGATLLCLTGTGDVLKMTKGTLLVDGVTIFLEEGADVNITGGHVEMYAPLEPEADAAPGIAGVIIYAASDDDPDNPDTFLNNPESKIDIEGNHESWYEGLIYAPAADIKITGEGDIGPTLHTQVIGWNVTLLGSASFDIIFDETWVSVVPTTLDLQE